jgi:hypothetical protein
MQEQVRDQRVRRAATLKRAAEAALWKNNRFKQDRKTGRELVNITEVANSITVYRTLPSLIHLAYRSAN